MDLGSLILAGILALGLIGADAVMNAGDINFDVQVTEDLTKKGYTPALVDAMIDNDLRELTNFQSIARPPQIRTAAERSIVGAMAESLNMKGVTAAFQADFGLNPVRLAGSLMPYGKDGQQLRFILAGNSRHTGEFIIDATSGDHTLPIFLQDMAIQVVARLEPYAAAFHQFNLLSQRLVSHAAVGITPTEFKAFIDDLVLAEAGRPDSDLDHAAFFNLLGLTEMMLQHHAQAEDDFKTALMMDPQLGIPAVNLALEYVSQHRFDEAIAMADKAAAAPSVRRIPYVVSNAYTAKALALWGQHDLQGASDNFLAAVRLHPGSLWGYFYWAELLDSNGDSKDAALLRMRAETNIDSTESSPEVAFPHVRVLTGADFALQPIDMAGLRHVAEIYMQK
jgi:tetratricopeptide (TPR) repeat protein